MLTPRATATQDHVGVAQGVGDGAERADLAEQAADAEQGDGDRDDLAEPLPRPSLRGRGGRRRDDGCGGTDSGCRGGGGAHHSRPARKLSTNNVTTTLAASHAGRDQARRVGRLQRWIEIRSRRRRQRPEAFEQRATVGVELGLQLGRDGQALGGGERLGDLVRA